MNTIFVRPIQTPCDDCHVFVMGGGNGWARKSYETFADYTLRFVGLSTQLINKTEFPNLEDFRSGVAKDIYFGLDRVAEYIGRRKLSAPSYWAQEFRSETGSYIIASVIAHPSNGSSNYTIIVVQSDRPVTAIQSSSGLIRCMASWRNGKVMEFIIT